MKRTVLLVVIAILTLLSATAAAQPSVEVTSHHDGETVKFSNIVLRGNASDPSGVSSVNVSLNRGPWRTATGNESWSIPLDLVEGPNVIVIVALSLDNNYTTQTIVIQYSIGGSDNSGVFLAGAIIVITIIMIVFVALRFRRAPPPEEKAEPETIEERLERIDDKGRKTPGSGGLPVDRRQGGPKAEKAVGSGDPEQKVETGDEEEGPPEEEEELDEDLVTTPGKKNR